MDSRHTARTQGHSGDDRLDSWKEIAAYLKRGVRAVQRWERDEKLPVHRHHHKKLGSVYAFRHEIDSWQAARAQRGAEGGAAAVPSAAGTAGPDQLGVRAVYEQGRFCWGKRTADGLKKAVRCFERVIDKDPRFAPAHSGLADSYNLLGYYSYLAPERAFPKARAAAVEALKLDAGLAEGHASLAFATMFHDWDWSGAQEHFRRALEVKPDYAVAHYWLGVNQAAQGLLWEAVAAIRRALEVEPSSRIIHTYVAGAYYFARQYERAVEKCQTVLEMESDFAPARLVLGWCHHQRGHHDLALAEFKKADALSGESADALAARGHVYGASGRKRLAEKILNELKARRRRRYVSAGHIALVYAGLGDTAKTLAWLETACRERYPWLVFLRVDPCFDAVRAEPLFKDLLKRIGPA